MQKLGDVSIGEGVSPFKLGQDLIQIVPLLGGWYVDCVASNFDEGTTTLTILKDGLRFDLVFEGEESDEDSKSLFLISCRYSDARKIELGLNAQQLANKLGVSIVIDPEIPSMSETDSYKIYVTQGGPGLVIYEDAGLVSEVTYSS